MTLLTDLDAFYLDHRRCGELEAGVEEPMVWMTCWCGATRLAAILRTSMARAYGRRRLGPGLTRPVTGPIVPAWTAAASC